MSIMRKLSLDQLTVVGISPLEMIRIAAEVGYDGISPIGLSAPEFDLPIQPFADDDELCAKMAALMRATGQRLFNIDGFPLFPATDVGRFAKPVQNCARLGARSITTLILDTEMRRAEDNYSRLCEMAQAVGLRVLLEFTPITQIGDLRGALDFMTRTKQPNAALQLDAYHFFHSGAVTEDIPHINPDWLISAQLCDGPRRQTPEQYAYNVLYERELPGQGEMPLVEFVRNLLPDVPIGIEVPLRSLSDRVSPLERARLALDASRQVLTAAKE
jgi:sugar phosphate isomerase/epimerase